MKKAERFSAKDEEVTAKDAKREETFNDPCASL